MPRGGLFEWVRNTGLMRRVKCGEAIRSLFNFLTFGDHIPSAVYTTDIRLLFVVSSMYASLVSQFRQAANQETTGDIGSGFSFRVNSEFTNHSISGGVSDRILWNCREESHTQFYYKTLYLGLIVSYFTAIFIYFVAKVFVTGFVANAVWTLTYNHKKVHHLELMANGFKMINQLSKNLKYIKNCAYKGKQSFEDFKIEFEKLATEWNEKWNKLVVGRKSKKFLYNWLIILYIIPRYETFIMLAIVTFALTSYDIHPLGCLSEIDVSYNEMEMSVTLKISDNVIRYQQACVIIISLLLVHWVEVKIVQYLLLPRRWGLWVTNCFSVNLQPCITDSLLSKCGCACKEMKCCSVTCSLPCGESGHYDDSMDDSYMISSL